MERRPTSILAALSISVLALTLIAPWVPGQDPDRIAEILRRAEQGDVDAQFTLGTLYSFSQILFANGGRVGPQSDPAEAAKWYRLAAEQGFAMRADTTSGVCTPTAGAFLRSDAEAVPGTAKLAAEQGFARAQHNLGLMYANGTGVPQDDVLAYAWLNLAVEQGNELASENKDKLRTRMTANQMARAQELSAALFDRINFAQ